MPADAAEFCIEKDLRYTVEPFLFMSGRFTHPMRRFAVVHPAPVEVKTL